MDYIRIGSLLAFLGVALGAFGAHALRERLSPAMLQVWNTAVLYHLLHAVALFALGLYARTSGADVKVGGTLLTAGVLVFSGSLYALALTGIKPLGAITPVGGLLFLAGWLWIAVRGL
ncbi:MAG TPA: DUF423 domain-containing protein [Fibrobacteria bacterium]|nr:DUF423 domain-containing protein [Fibrobacteria bacterium]